MRPGDDALSSARPKSSPDWAVKEAISVPSGTATLGGTLDISLIEEFESSAGDSFEIITFASCSGAFDTINGLDLGGGLSLLPVYDAGSLTLLTVPEPTTLGLLMIGGLGLLRRRRKG